MLEKLGFKKRIHVGISLSANNFIELVCVDRESKSVVKYAAGNIKYNNAIREIMDFDEFQEVVEGLFEDVGLDPHDCAVTLNLPNVQFGITAVESISDTPYIIENLQSEIEDLYIFKRNEPIISYSVLEDMHDKERKNIVYSAIQHKIVSKIMEVFENLDIEIVRIDNSYSSIFKALQFCDKFNKYLQKETKTSILLITPNSCCSFYLQDGILLDAFEEPLAIKSFSTEEVYSSVSRIGKGAIAKNHPKSLLIISEIDEVNSELLAEKLEFDGDIDCTNKSSELSEQFIQVSGATSDIDVNTVSYMTVEAVGAAVADYDEYPVNINFLPPEKIDANMVRVGEYEINFYKYSLTLAIATVVVAFLTCALIGFFIKSGSNSIKSKIRSQENEIKVFRNTIETSKEKQKKDIIPIITDILERNKKITDVYIALSTEIPESIYIKKFITTPNGGIGIMGEAKTSESVQDFVKGLREKDTDLMLSKLSINSKDSIEPVIIPNGFTFEIKTSTTDVAMDSNIEPVQTNQNIRPSKNYGAITPPPAPMI